MGQFRRLLGYLKPYRQRVGFAVFLLLCQSITPNIMPLILRYALDDVLPHKKMGALNLIFWSIFALYAFRGIISFVLNYLIGWLGQRIVFDLRFQSYRHLNRLSLAYYDTRQTGKIMARLMGDIDFIQQMISGGFVTFMADLFSVVVVLMLLFSIQWKLALVALIAVPLYVINYKLFIRHIRPFSEELREKWDAMLGTLAGETDGHQCRESVRARGLRDRKVHADGAGQLHARHDADEDEPQAGRVRAGDTRRGNGAGPLVRRRADHAPPTAHRRTARLQRL